ncbi:hypothetical protein HYT92_00695 [Candidatus Pacearchaeota archaeon]|nr:hypothetical protein [Candidatus Pacearchaeota archaeon]
MIEGLGTIVIISGCCTSAVNNAKRRLNRCPTCRTKINDCIRHTAQKTNMQRLEAGGKSKGF